MMLGLPTWAALADGIGVEGATYRVVAVHGVCQAGPRAAGCPVGTPGAVRGLEHPST